MIRLDTDFDVAARPAGLPMTLTRGDDPALRLVDGLVRGVTLPGRFQHSPALFGLKIDPAGERTAVTVTLGADATSEKWWADRGPGDGEPGRPRLLAIGAQGRTRAAVLLPGERTEPVTVTTTFELEPADLDPDGLLIIETGDPSAVLPGWLTAVTMRKPAIGVTVAKVELAAGTAVPVPPATTAAVGTGLFLVPPGPDNRLWRLRLDTGHGDDPAPDGDDREVRTGTALPPSPNIGSTIPHGRPLPPPEPRNRVGRWAAGLRARAAAEGRLNGQGKELRGERPELEISGHAAATRAPARTDPPFAASSVVAGLLADLVRERRLRVRLAGLHTGTEQPLRLSLVGAGELEIRTSRPVDEPSAIRVDAAEDELFAAPELRRPGVVWHLIG